MSNSQPVRIGMLSFAHGHAYSYARALTQIPGVEIGGIYDDDRAHARKAAEQFSAEVFSSAEELLQQNLDGIIVCSENARHARHVQLAAARTRNILCEKPIATTIADAQGMINHCRANGARLQIAFPVRFSPPLRHLKAMLDRNELGKIFAVKCTNHGSMPGGWFQDKTLAGGGAVIDHTVHVIDILRWFWGAEVTEVYAEVGTRILHPDVEIDDVGLLSFRLANNVYGTLDTSWSRPASYPTWGDVKIEVIAERGVVTVNSLNQNLSVSSDHWGKMRWIHWGSNLDFALISDFIDMIRTDRPPTITGEDGLRALEVALAAYESAAKVQPVQIAQPA